jgi:hypothetical protein
MARTSNKSCAWITYLPDPEDPPSVRWQGHVFHANMPKKVHQSALIEKARANRFFRVGNSPRQGTVSTAPISVPRRRRPQVTFSEIDRIADDVAHELEYPPLMEDKKRELLHNINEALDNYAIEDRHEKLPTLNQFTKSFLSVRAKLKRLKQVLPAPHGDDCDRQLFEAICWHGETYAAEHGPHLGLDPIELPEIPLPYALEILGIERLEPKRKYRSARRLQELIEAVDEVCAWVNQYDEDLIPNMGWKRLERYWTAVAAKHGRSKNERLSGAHVRLIGHGLPRVYEGHFESLPRSASSSGGRDRDERIYKPWVKFVRAVYEAAFQKRLSLATIEEYWKRMRYAGLKAELPIGPEWQNKPD